MKHIRREWLCLSFLALIALAACGGGGGSGGGSSAPSDPVSTVTVGPASASVAVGDQLQLAATTRDAMGNVLTGRVVTWTSSNAGIATVSATGMVVALASGQATITASSEGQSGSAPLTAYPGLVFTAVSAGGRHTCGLIQSGAAYCWGDNSSGQLGDGTTNNSAMPIPVAGGVNFATVSAGASHTCGIAVSGAGYCWGDNSSGQLGNGTTTNSATPVSVLGGHAFLTLSAGVRHTCAMSPSDLPTVPKPNSAGALFCWGDNASGQLGDGTMTNRTAPVLVLGIENWAGSVGAGSNHTCAVGYSGGLTHIPVPLCWGDNSAGQLGNSTIPNSAMPVATLPALIPSIMSAGTNYSCEISGLVLPTILCWGNNSSGQLGNGSTTNSSMPLGVSGNLNFWGVSAGASHACGPSISADGLTFTATYCWGDNSFGQLGNGTTTNSSVPIAIAGGLNFAWVSAGGRHTCALRSSSPPHSVTVSGTIYCWGDNTFGQLGDGGTTSSLAPVKVGGQA